MRSRHRHKARQVALEPRTLRELPRPSGVGLIHAADDDDVGAAPGGGDPQGVDVPQTVLKAARRDNKSMVMSPLKHRVNDLIKQRMA